MVGEGPLAEMILHKSLEEDDMLIRANSDYTLTKVQALSKTLA